MEHPKEQVERYIDGVLGGEIVTGRRVRQAVERHVWDLDHAGERGFYFDEEKAAASVLWFPISLRHVEGEWAGRPVELSDSQAFISWCLFGWRRANGCRRFRHAYITCARKWGKALSLDTKLATPAGFTTMGDVRIGDCLIAPDGSPVKVLAATAVMENRECYRVTFSTGESVICDANHEWLTITKNEKRAALKAGKANKPTKKTAEQIAATLKVGHEWNHSVPTARFLGVENDSLPIQPYTLGAWLGDGLSDSMRIVNAYGDAQILDGIKSDGYMLKEHKTKDKKTGLFRICNSAGRSQQERNRSVQAIANRMGILRNKHIPEEYLCSSVGQRLELLQGLMDTDGNIETNGRCECVQVNERLARDVHRLVCSLGLRAYISKHDAKLNGRKVSDKWRVRFYGEQALMPFRLPRKADRVRTEIKKRTDRTIVGCKKVQSVPVRCVTVEGGAYLCSESYIQTHNSTYAAGTGLQMVTFDDPFEHGAQVYCAATKEDQAKIVHGLAKAMAEGSPEIRKQANVLAKSIVTKKGSYQPNSYFKPLGSDSRTSDGFNVHAAILDEIHEWGDHHKGLWDKLNTAHGSRRQPLIITITTAGDDMSKLWLDVDKLNCQVLDNYDADEPPGDHRFAFIARLDEKRPCDCGGLDACPKCSGTGEIPEDDPFDETNWPKANPNYPITPKREFMREQAADAKLSPANLHVFKRYHCNVLVSSLDKAISDELWRRSKGEFSDWDDADVICGGWDMGGQDDLAAIGLCARFETGLFESDPKTGESTNKPLYRYEVDAVGFINNEAERDVAKEPFGDWVRQGLLRQSPLEINEMRQEILREFKDNNVRSWAYDPANSRDFAQSLEPEGLECVKFYQNAGMYTEPLTNFLSLLKRGRIKHDGNGLLSWAASNMVIVNMSRKASLQVMPDKGSSPEKIDPIVAVIMAFRCAQIAPARSKGSLFIT